MTDPGHNMQAIVGALDEYQGPAIPFALGQALAFKTYAELLRRHPQRDLRVFLLHPGDGQYWCVTLAEGTINAGQAMWNLAGTSLALSGTQTVRWPHFLAPQRKAYEFLEQYYNWSPTPVAKPRTAALSFAVLAELAARYALNLTPPKLVCGWYDSSGIEGSKVQSWAEEHPRVLPNLGPKNAEWTVCAQAAGRLWAIEGEEWGSAAVVVDLPSGDVSDASGAPRWSIVHEYQKGAGIRELAWRLECEWRT